ncbi:MAG: iron ABC transporter permease [Proteobacteria bacterium]|nr:iron ABC transporter permease [Pseudomonadota bacterium]
MPSTSVSEESIGTSSEIKEQYQKFIGRKVIFILSLPPLLFLICAISASLGSAPITIGDASAAFLHKFFPSYFDPSRLAERVVWFMRLPRIFMGVAAGIGLGIAGSVMQGVLKNPLASPYTLGIASGAGFGAALALTLGVGLVEGKYLIIGNAFLFALICSFIIVGLVSYKDATPETMILAGIAMMYFFSAMTTLLQYIAGPMATAAVVFWLIGDLGESSWGELSLITIVFVCCIPLLLWKSWDLNVMGAGDETAKSLGVNVERVRIFMMIAASLLVAGIVCFTGTIGFIGLVAPHITRMAIGGDNRFLLPASGLVGAVILVGADTVARMVIAPVIIPVGVMTAFLGVPLFFYLIMRRRKRYW